MVVLACMKRKTKPSRVLANIHGLATDVKIKWVIMTLIIKKGKIFWVMLFIFFNIRFNNLTLASEIVKWVVSWQTVGGSFSMNKDVEEMNLAHDGTQYELKMLRYSWKNFDFESRIEFSYFISLHLPGNSTCKEIYHNKL